jgi:hypothetical protein
MSLKAFSKVYAERASKKHGKHHISHTSVKKSSALESILYSLHVVLQKPMEKAKVLRFLGEAYHRHIEAYRLRKNNQQKKQNREPVRDERLDIDFGVVL